MFYFVSTPWLLKQAYKGCIWDIKTNQNNIYLTFDDGPHPEITPYVLNELRKYNAKATFFCIGKHVVSSPDIYENILNEGHAVGNHTFNHLNGWKTGDEAYENDIIKAKEVIDSTLFRPPYGRITRFQLQLLKGKRLALKPIMWSVLSGDFDTSLSNETCYLNVVNNTVAGSIVVFHDSEKAFQRLEYTLPRVLKYYSDKGYCFKVLN